MTSYTIGGRITLADWGSALMFPPGVRWQILLPLFLLTAVLGLAGQKNGSPPKAALQNQQPSKSTQSESGGNSVTSHPHHLIRFHLGPVMAGAGYTYFSGLAFLPLPYAYPFWGYYGYAPFGGPGFYGYPPYAFNFGSSYGKGQVKLEVQPKAAEVLIDNAYAGTVASLKGSMWLSPGAYSVCFKASGHSDFCRRIYVLSGKKLESCPISRRAMEGEAMKLTLGLSMLAILTLPLMAQGPQGTVPRDSAVKYQAHAETNGAAIGASFSHQRKSIATSDGP